MRRVVPSAVLLLVAVLFLPGQGSAPGDRSPTEHQRSFRLRRVRPAPVPRCGPRRPRAALHPCPPERPGEPAHLPPELHRGDGLQYTDQRGHERRHLGQIRVRSSSAHSDLGGAVVRGARADAGQGPFPNGRRGQRIQVHQHSNHAAQRARLRFHSRRRWRQQSRQYRLRERCPRSPHQPGRQGVRRYRGADLRVAGSGGSRRRGAAGAHLDRRRQRRADLPGRGEHPAQPRDSGQSKADRAHLVKQGPPPASGTWPADSRCSWRKASAVDLAFSGRCDSRPARSKTCSGWASTPCAGSASSRVGTEASARTRTWGTSTGAATRRTTPSWPPWDSTSCWDLGHVRGGCDLGMAGRDDQAAAAGAGRPRDAGRRRDVGPHHSAQQHYGPQRQRDPGLIRIQVHNPLAASP